jgi:acetolactate synthase-1/2/3 large subunit
LTTSSSNPETVAEAYLGLLASRGIAYLFANGGTDFAPIVEAYAKGRARGWKMPEPVMVPHENLGVAMAHGVTMISGRPQAMMVHVGVGTANALNGLINASRQNIPMLFTAGRTPWTEFGQVPGGRNNFIHWAQEHFDQAAMLREFVKWDYELRHAAQLETAVDRALAIAKSEPQGPVYLTLPREVLASGFSGIGLSPESTLACVSPPVPDSEAIEEAARLLGRAEAPLLITANAGRTPEDAMAIQRLAETLAIPVIHYRPRHFALPTEHAMMAGWDPQAWLPRADVILVVDCDVPWIPSQAQPNARARVVHAGPDPLWQRYPLRGFRTDVALAGRVAPALLSLCERALRYAPGETALASRRDRISKETQALRAKNRSGPDAIPKNITSQWLSACLNRLLDAQTLLVNEYPLVLEELTLGRTGQYFSHPPSGGLGWGMGAALGAKLAAPAKTVICALGDGAYMFGNPTPAHYVSEAMKLPVLWVIFNNARWAAVHRATLAMYPQGAASKMTEPWFSTLEPSPRFERVIEASGGYGVRVEQPAEAMPALERALRAVKEEKRQALVNVCVEPSLVKTS